MKKSVKFLKTLKTLKEYFNSRLIVIYKNKKIAKKFITKKIETITRVIAYEVDFISFHFIFIS